VRVGLLASILVVVLVASALNLAVGGLWVVLVVVLGVLQRRRRLIPGLALVLVLGAAFGLAVGGKLGAPAETSYARDEVARVRHALAGAREPSRLERARTELLARVETLRGVELGMAPADLERVTAAVVASARELRRWRQKAPEAVAAADDAVRQLALTLISTEFRDLDARAQRLHRWLADVEVRARLAPDEAELAAIGRALEPAAMSRVSFRALREDLGAVDRAMRGLVRASGGGDVRASATSRITLGESAGRVTREDRYVLEVTPPLRLSRVDAEGLRRMDARGGEIRTLAYRVEHGEPRELPAGGPLILSPPVRRLVLEREVTRPVRFTAVRAALRPLAFQRLEAWPGAEGPVRAVTGVVVEDGGPEVFLAADLGPPRLQAVWLPRYALYYASAPGTRVAENGHEAWMPPPGGAPTVPVALELVPPSGWLRNRLFERVRPYLYGWSPTTILALLGLSALTVLLGRRPRWSPPPSGG
jgi:hypothetical protein